MCYMLQAHITDDGKNVLIKSGVRTGYEHSFKFVSFFTSEFKIFIGALLTLNDTVLTTSPPWSLHGRRGRYVKRNGWNDVTWF